MKHLAKFAAAGLCAALLGGCVIAIADRSDDSGRGQCDGAKYQSLLGKEASSIDRATLPESFRIVCAGCATTKDYRSDRLTLQLDASNRVASATCG